ncbi:MAG: RNB domain-containing ribonuclease [Rubrivivax sp.]
MDAAALRRIAEQAMLACGLRPAFEPAVLQEVQARAAAGPDAGGDVHDLRALPWFSIDNDDTRDLDQLSCAEPLASGVSLLRVAVAEVDAMVRRGGAIDEHAAANTTSVYTAAGVFPMLPERLSTDLTSLHPDQDRLAVVVELQVDAEGAVAAPPAIRRAVVRNQAKLAYDGVAAWLDGRGPLPPAARGFEGQLRLHDALAERLRGWRQRRGALNLATVNARPVFDADGELVDLRADGRNRAKDLIADLMIATNAATARFLARHGMPSLRRFLQSPQRWDRIVALATAHGGALPAAPDAPALEHFLAARRTADPQRYAELSLAVVKLLGSGDYIAEPPQDQADAAADPAAGHFGLAVADYAHSTAPNRRFPDLVTQRLLKAVLAGDGPPYALDALQAIAAHCTRQEDMANKVERQVLKTAAAYLLQHRVGECFDGLVTGTPSKGTFARIARPLVEGRVVRGFEGLEVGDTPRLRLLAVDPEQGHIDFERC